MAQAVAEPRKTKRELPRRYRTAGRPPRKYARAGRAVAHPYYELPRFKALPTWYAGYINGKRVTRWTRAEADARMALRHILAGKHPAEVSQLDVVVQSRQSERRPVDAEQV